jgi:hypothetical protein
MGILIGSACDLISVRTSVKAKPAGLASFFRQWADSYGLLINRIPD